MEKKLTDNSGEAFFRNRGPLTEKQGRKPARRQTLVPVVSAVFFCRFSARLCPVQRRMRRTAGSGRFRTREAQFAGGNLSAVRGQISVDIR